MTKEQYPPVRLPAEWEMQDAILLAWPHEETDWQPLLAEATAVYIEMARHITRFQKLIIATPKPSQVVSQLAATGIDSTKVTLVEVPTNDTWTRDYGPLTIYRQNQPELLDFGFNGWGLKFPSNLDNMVTRTLHAQGVLGTTPCQTIGLILEGGSIESDGSGTLLTTSECLLNPNRNPHLSKEQIEATLRQQFGVSRVLWLDHGYLAGDDTDAHIDTLARLCPDDTILYVSCDNPQDEHFTEFEKMTRQLERFRTRAGTAYRLLPLPWPQPIYDENNARLPATYANYLVINDAVLVPTYADPADDEALAMIARVYPDREMIAIDARPIIRQHGSLHCISMQLPSGVLS